LPKYFTRSDIYEGGGSALDSSGSDQRAMTSRTRRQVVMNFVFNTVQISWVITSCVGRLTHYLVSQFL